MAGHENVWKALIRSIEGQCRSKARRNAPKTVNFAVASRRPLQREEKRGRRRRHKFNKPKAVVQRNATIAANIWPLDGNPLVPSHACRDHPMKPLYSLTITKGSVADGAQFSTCTRPPLPAPFDPAACVVMPSRAISCRASLSPHDLIYPVFVTEGQSLHYCRTVHARRGTPELDELLRSRAVRRPWRPVLALFSGDRHRAQDLRRARALNWRTYGTSRGAGAQTSVSRPGVMTDVARPVHEPHWRTVCSTETGYITQRRNRARARGPSASASRSGRRHPSRQRRWMAASAPFDRRSKPMNIHTRIMAYGAEYAKRLLRPVPRRRGLGRQLGKSNKRSTRWIRRLPATKPCARLPWTQPGSADMVMVQAWRTPLPRHRASREGRSSACRPSPIRSAASTPCSRPPPPTAGSTTTP